METVKGPDRTHDELLISLVDQYQCSLLRLCFIYLHDKALAEDAVQETFLKAYRSLSSFRGDSSTKTWLTRIAMNTCRDMRRAGWFRFMDRHVTPEDVPPVPVQPFDNGDSDALAQAIIRLPVKQKEVILLYYYHDMTMKEIADTLGINVSSVSGRLKHAHTRLRDLLEKEDAYE
ncbi:MAG: sigma-70 family RNA polymerase sigma factor [Clostridia bacterium]|nr:sigma-70 family RNA polymerase sigma factor [Clostridia bacterium]